MWASLRDASFSGHLKSIFQSLLCDQVIVAQWLALRLVTGEVPSSNPGKGDNYYLQRFSFCAPMVSKHDLQ